MATIRDVARVAGVSVTTVSAAINGTAPVSAEARAQVQAAIREVGYRPNPLAQNLRSGKSTLIGLTVPDIALPYAAILAKTTQRAFAEKGYGVFFASNDDDPEREMADIRRMLHHRVAGLLLMPTSLGPNYAETLAEAVTCPAVLVDRVLPGARFDCVADDNRQGARLLVRYLHRLGHRRIAVLGGRDSISTSAERIDGALAAAAEGGAPLDPALVLHDHQREEHAFRAVQHLMLLPEPPTAILSINSPQTRGIVKGLRNLGMTAPADLSIASFDGFHMTEGWEPSITSLQQDIDGIAESAASRLLARLAGAPGQAPSTLRILPRLQLRNSCRAIGP